MKDMMTIPFWLKDVFPLLGSVVLHGSLIGVLIFQGESETSGLYQAPLPSIPIFLLPSEKSQKQALEGDFSLSNHEEKDVTEEAAEKIFLPKKKTLKEKKHQKPASLKTVSSVHSQKETQSSSKRTEKGAFLSKSIGVQNQDNTNSVVDLSKPVYSPKPSYPLLARRKKWEGRASIRLMVDPEGRVCETHLVSSSSHDILDQTALKVLKEWRFPKACQSCVSRSYTVPISFSLKE